MISARPHTALPTHQWDSRYADRVQLLVDLLPTVARERRFALKGGTAINLFDHDLPRLSADLDLTWLPVQGFHTAMVEMDAALASLSRMLCARLDGVEVQWSSAGETALSTRLIVARGRARVTIETTPVMRGSLHPVRWMGVQPAVERRFGFAEIQVLEHADLYAGTLVLALQRQRPRDLFDCGSLLDRDGLRERLWRTFLVQACCNPKPVAELLDPTEPDNLDTVFQLHFHKLTAVPTTVAALRAIRTRLLARIAELLDERACTFLQSMEAEAPDFGLLGLPHAAALPGVRRKLRKLALRPAEQRAADQQRLAETLARISTAGYG